MPKKSQPQKPQKPLPVPLTITRDGEDVVLAWFTEPKCPTVQEVLVTRDTYKTIGLRLGIPEIDPDVRSFLENSWWSLDPSDRCWFLYTLDMMRRHLQAQGRN